MKCAACGPRRVLRTSTALLALLGACAAPRTLDSSSVRQLTTQDSADEVRRVLGPANARRSNDDGSFALDYQRRCGSADAERAGKPLLGCWEYCEISFSPLGQFTGSACTSDVLPPD